MIPPLTTAGDHPPARPPLLRKHPELSALRVHAFGLTAGLVTGVDYVASAMLGIAGSHIQGGLHASPLEYLWALTGFAAAAVVANLVIGQFASQISYRRFILASLAVFILGSLLCAGAQNITELTLARVVQGLGGGALFTAARIIVQLVSAPDERRTLFFGFCAGSFGLLALAPVLSAHLVENQGWRGVFLVQASLAVPVMLLVQLTFPRRVRPPGRLRLGHLDWFVALTFGVGLLLVLHALEDVRYLRFAAEPALAMTTVIGGILFVSALWRLHRHPDAWLDPRKLLGRRYLVGLAFYSLYYLFSGAWNYLLPSFLQAGLGYDFHTTAYVMSFGSSITLVAALGFLLILPKVFRKRRVIFGGYLALALALWLISERAMTGASVAAILPAVALEGLTTPMLILQVATMTYLDLTDEDFAHGYQLKNIMREVVTALGIGLASLELQSRQAQARNDLVGNLDAESLPRFLPGGATAEGLARWSAEIDRQASLIASQQLFLIVAALCVVAAVVVAWQKALR